MPAPDHHLPELSAHDTALLREERGPAHTHVGGIAILRGTTPPIDDVRALVRSRLGRVPRYRSRLVRPPFGIGRPRWAVDPSFNLEYHVRHLALPHPGGEPELRSAAARLFSQRLDRTKPLWELWVVEGVDEERFGLVAKSHQVLVDGVEAADLMTALLDDVPGDGTVEAGGGWLAPPLPTAAQLLAAAAATGARSAVTAPVRFARDAARPAAALDAVRDAAVEARRLAGDRLSPAPPSPLNVPIGPHRRLSRTSVDLADLKAVKDTFGGTVHDVVLAVVAGALRHWMHERGLRTEGLELRAGVPVAVEERRGETRPIALTVAPLPVGEPDPVARLERIRRATAGAMGGRRAVGAVAQSDAEGFAAPSVLAQASRLNLSPRRFNVLVTNVPGPRKPMHLLGRTMETMVPVPFLSGDRALAVAVLSYAGRAEIGLLGDLDKLPDIEAVAEGVQVALAELLARVRDGRPRSPGRPAPVA